MDITEKDLGHEAPQAAQVTFDLAEDDREGPRGGPRTSALEAVMPWSSSPPNVAASGAADALRSWAERFGLLEDPSRGAILASARPAHVAARLYPTAPPAVVVLAAEWLTVNFLVDDLLDAEDDPGSCESVADGILGAFGSGPAAGDPLHVAVAELWGRTAAGRSVGWCRTFRADHADWLGTYAREAIDRGSGRVPPIGEYRRHRQLSSGMLVFADLAEIAADVDLPAGIRGLDPVPALRAATSEYMGLVNDVYSMGKELTSGQVHNAMCVVMFHTGAELADALYAVTGMAAECLRIFGDAARSPGLAVDVTQCADVYRMLMRGALDCCAELDRYATPLIAISEGTSA
jgi:(+)-beta-caryophyllene/(+)-caryolan-1-ol synthase